jgi:hypothetical protein
VTITVTIFFILKWIILEIAVGTWHECDHQGQNEEMIMQMVVVCLSDLSVFILNEEQTLS